MAEQYRIIETDDSKELESAMNAASKLGFTQRGMMLQRLSGKLVVEMCHREEVEDRAEKKPSKKPAKKSKWDDGKPTTTALG